VACDNIIMMADGLLTAWINATRNEATERVHVTIKLEVLGSNVGYSAFMILISLEKYCFKPRPLPSESFHPTTWCYIHVYTI
jgi:hypothetical protein